MKTTEKRGAGIAIGTSEKKHTLRKYFMSAAVIRFFSYLSTVIYRAAAESRIGCFLQNYIPRSARASGTLLHRLLEKLRLRGRVLRPLKFSVARLLDESRIINACRNFLRGLIALPLYWYGLFVICFGAAALLQQGVLFFLGLPMHLTTTEMLISITAVVISFPLFSSTKNLAHSLSCSVFADLFLFRILGARREEFKDVQTKAFPPLIPVMLGLALGGATYVCPMKYYFLAFSALCVALLIIKIPECGIVGMLFFLPFLPTKALAALMIYIACSYFIKLIAGRRTLRFETLDWWVLLLMVLYFLGGIFSSNVSLSLGPMCMILCFMFGYFAVVNLIRSEAWFRRCAGAILCTTVLVSLYGIYQYVFGTLMKTWLDEEMFSFISTRVISTFGNPNVLGEFLVMSVPFFYIYFFSRKGFSKKILSLIPGGICLLCLVLTWSRGAWLGILLGTLVFFLLYSRHSLTVLLFGTLAIPFLPSILPQNVLLRFSSIGNMADSSTSYRVNIWLATIKLIRDYFFGGIGTGINVFKTIYPRYAHSGIEAAPHSHSLYLQIMMELGIFGLLAFFICIIFFAKQSISVLGDSRKNPLRFWVLAGFCGILAVLAQGATDYVFYNYRVMLWLWLCLGLTSAGARIIRRQGQRETVL